MIINPSGIVGSTSIAGKSRTKPFLVSSVKKNGGSARFTPTLIEYSSCRNGFRESRLVQPGHESAPSGMSSVSRFQIGGQSLNSSELDPSKICKIYINLSHSININRTCQLFIHCPFTSSKQSIIRYVRRCIRFIGDSTSYQHPKWAVLPHDTWIMTLKRN